MRQHVFEDIFGRQVKLGDFILKPVGDHFQLQQVTGIKNSLACNKINYKYVAYDKVKGSIYHYELKRVYLKAGKQFLIFNPPEELEELFSRPITETDAVTINKHRAFL